MEGTDVIELHPQERSDMVDLLGRHDPRFEEADVQTLTRIWSEYSSLSDSELVERYREVYTRIMGEIGRSG